MLTDLRRVTKTWLLLEEVHALRREIRRSVQVAEGRVTVALTFFFLLGCSFQMTLLRPLPLKFVSSVVLSSQVEAE